MILYYQFPGGGSSLTHHGIKGQKWGVRRYQNEDGTLTAEGKKRVNTYKKYTELLEKKNKEVNKLIDSDEELFDIDFDDPEEIAFLEAEGINVKGLKLANQSYSTFVEDNRELIIEGRDIVLELDEDILEQTVGEMNSVLLSEYFRSKYI